MNKIVHTLTVSAIAVLMLTGCSAAPVEEVAPSAPPTEVVAESTPESTPEPLAVDEEPAAENGGDVMFLKETRERIQYIKNATDEQLIEAAGVACENFAAGQSRMDMRLIEGEQADDSGWYWDSIAIATWAAKAYCPKYDELA
jgi:hypothetical protein